MCTCNNLYIAAARLGAAGGHGAGQGLRRPEEAAGVQPVRVARARDEAAAVLQEAAQLPLHDAQRADEVHEAVEGGEPVDRELVLEVQEVLAGSHRAVQLRRAVHVGVVNHADALGVRAEAQRQVVEAEERAGRREEAGRDELVGAGAQQHPRAAAGVVVA